MINKLLIILLAGVFVFGLFSLAQAGKGNGFPEGDHYNLNLIAKKSNPAEGGYFTCPDANSYQNDFYKNNGELFCSETTGILDIPDNCIKCDPNLEECPVIIPSAQNVIFVPRDNDVDLQEGPDMDISILIKSGSARPNKGKKISDTYPALTVTDWCTEHFPNDGDQDGSGAVFQLPENKNGYGVYARLTGKPTDNPTWTFMKPSIELVEDEYGNDLYYFGNVGGAEGCTDAEGEIMLDRIDTSKGNGKGKGVNKATDLSCLFDFSGEVCYVNDLCYYCPDDDPQCNPTTMVPDFLCCANELDAEDYIIEDSCGMPANFACAAPTWGCIETDPESPDACLEEGYLCQDEALPVEVGLMCYDWPEDTWVFDIADFVDVLWKSKTSGAYVVQLRFYPR